MIPNFICTYLILMGVVILFLLWANNDHDHRGRR